MNIFLAPFRHVAKLCHLCIRRVAGRVGDRNISRHHIPDLTDSNVTYDPANPLHRRAFRQFEKQRQAHQRARRNARNQTFLRGAEAFLADDLERTAREEAVAAAKRRHPSSTNVVYLNNTNVVDLNDRRATSNHHHNTSDPHVYHGTYPWSVD